MKTPLKASGVSKNRKKPKTRKGGRPTAYSPSMCTAVLKYFEREPWTELERTITRKDGSQVTEKVRQPVELPTLAGFACSIGCHRDTLHDWSKKHPDFADAILRAKDHQARILVANGLSGLYEGPFSVFTAKNILGWRDKTEITGGSEPGDAPIAMSLADHTAAFAALRAKMDRRLGEG